MRLPSPSVARSPRALSDEAAEVEARAWIEQVVGSGLKGDTLTEALKDGQALCRLVNTLRPGTITKIETSHVAFKQMANITAFIKGCRTLGVREHSLFETLVSGNITSTLASHRSSDSDASDDKNLFTIAGIHATGIFYVS